MRYVILLASVFACGAPAPHAPRPSAGSISGLARDQDSGDPIARADIEVRHQPCGLATRCPADYRLHATTSDRGLYDVSGLAPGRYELTARFAGQPVNVSNIDVTTGEVTVVDLTFTLGRPDPLRIDFGNPKASEIQHYRPHGLAPAVAIIEGTVSDTATRERIAGAVVTAVRKSTFDQTEQTVTDERGRFLFERIAPGTYAVSTYYSIGGRGQIEVRRSDITVHGAEAVSVPLWIETVR